MRLSTVVMIAVVGIQINLSIAPFGLCDSDPVQTDPSFLLAIESGQSIPANVEPGTGCVCEQEGTVQCDLGTSAPGQKAVLTLSCDAGSWPATITPTQFEFTRAYLSDRFRINITVPEGVSSTFYQTVTISGHWELLPGTKEGDIEPFHTAVGVMAYSDVNLTIEGEGRKEAAIGREVDFTIIIHNRGNAADHYRVSMATDGDCHARSDDMNVSVLEKASTRIVFTVDQVKGSPGLKTFILYVSGQYPGQRGHASVTFYLDTKFGAVTLFVEPWGLIIIAILMIITVAITFFATRFVLKRRRVGRIRSKGL